MSLRKATKLKGRKSPSRTRDSKGEVPADNAKEGLVMIMTILFAIGVIIIDEIEKQTVNEANSKCDECGCVGQGWNDKQAHYVGCKLNPNPPFFQVRDDRKSAKRNSRSNRKNRLPSVQNLHLGHRKTLPKTR